MYKLFLILSFIIVFLTSCSQKNIQIADLTNYSQNPNSYTENLQVSLENQDILAKRYLTKYFEPWSLNQLSISKKEATWGNIYKDKKIYLENHNLASKQWFEKLIDNSNFKNFNRVLEKAIIVKNTNVRVFPTISKLFYNPSVAGEGFPFDYNQNSTIKINTPILISHYSKDKAWAYIQSHFVYGWIRVDNLAFVDDDFIKKFKSYDFSVSIKDNFPIFDQSFIDYVKIGTLFPSSLDSFLITKKNLNSQGVLVKINIKKEYVSKFPLEFNSNNLSKLSNEFLDEMYGWGGLLNHRDCSSFTQDFFTSFGVYLNRNSKAQIKGYTYLDISKLSDKKKKKHIVENAIPFLSLIYLKGHIMLYIGHKNNEPLVMHNMWGVRTWKYPFVEGRNVVGKTVITTLEPGKELENANTYSTILKKVQGIVLLNKEYN